MTEPAPIELTAVLDHTVVVAALREQLAHGTPQLFPFLPSDPKMPASSALATSWSPRVRACGLEVVLHRGELVQGLAAAIAANPLRATEIADYGATLAGRLSPEPPALDALSGTASDLERVIGLLRPEFVVTVDSRVLSMHVRDPFAVRPAEWLRIVINATRAAHR